MRVYGTTSRSLGLFTNSGVLLDLWCCFIVSCLSSVEVKHEAIRILLVSYFVQFAFLALSPVHPLVARRFKSKAFLWLISSTWSVYGNVRSFLF